MELILECEIGRYSFIKGCNYFLTLKSGFLFTWNFCWKNAVFASENMRSITMNWRKTFQNYESLYNLNSWIICYIKYVVGKLTGNPRSILRKIAPGQLDKWLPIKLPEHVLDNHIIFLEVLFMLWSLSPGGPLRVSFCMTACASVFCTPPRKALRPPASSPLPPQLQQNQLWLKTVCNFS